MLVEPLLEIHKLQRELLWKWLELIQHLLMILRAVLLKVLLLLLAQL